MVARPAPATIRPWRDAEGWTPLEVHAALSGGERVRMGLAQYVAVLVSPDLEEVAREDISAFYRKHDITIRGR
jgi:hypothetical protein